MLILVPQLASFHFFEGCPKSRVPGLFVGGGGGGDGDDDGGGELLSDMLSFDFNFVLSDDFLRKKV